VISEQILNQGEVGELYSVVKNKNFLVDRSFFFTIYEGKAPIGCIGFVEQPKSIYKDFSLLVE